MPPSPSSPPVVIVTGASSGIGRATALAYAARGAHLVLAARGEELLRRATVECLEAGAATATTVPTDVRDSAAVDALVCGAVGRHARVDVVVHAAMVMAYGRLEDVPPAVYEQVVDTALKGTANVARASLPVLRASGGGALVVVTSVVGSIAIPGIGSYVAAKWGQLGLARVLQLETRGEEGIDVITVAPGPIATPIWVRAANYAGRAGRPPPGAGPPEKVTEAILRAVDGRRRRVSVGLLNPVMVAGFRFVTPVYERIVGPLYARLVHGRERIAPTEGNVTTESRPG
ncbi:SDR family oxidoreductase [Iamia sp. SCSIO 61187]|uniref:SDR family NAD(P)-dependent oxidoreductase n=1 Tax=Iamia sp. SCSIO 61187 TaxID=2722752 RepID=UPI001C63271A|nr:SDR family oxidoreductase [Iamia sp. SCSIO 61187]QYG91876.1 SDR family oxidoreductase [Iamia sp. SCSIO 61187]